MTSERQLLSKFGEQSWLIGKKSGEYFIKHRMSPNHIPDNSVDLFDQIFPDILGKCVGDKKKEAILFFAMQTFNYGLHLPGLGYPYADQEAYQILNTKTKDPKRNRFNRESKISELFLEKQGG